MKPPRVTERRIVKRKPGSGGYYGLCHFDKSLVEIDPRQTEEERLDTLLHELIHRIDWELKLGLTEEQVAAAGTMQKAVLWSAGYRRVKL